MQYGNEANFNKKRQSARLLLFTSLNEKCFSYFVLIIYFCYEQHLP